MRTFLLAVAIALGGCGPKAVQLYDGPKLPDNEVIVLYSNPHLLMSVDRAFEITEAERGKLHKLEVSPGHHAIEVRCVYSEDIKYHPPGKSVPKDVEAPPPPPDAPQYTHSPIIALLLDGEPGHAFKARAHFTRNSQGIPGCRVKLFDITADGSSKDENLY
jgi:hypothetical protein